MDYLKNLAKDSKSTATTTTTTSSSSNSDPSSTATTQIPDALATDVSKLTGVSAEQVKTVGGKVVEQYEKGRLPKQGNDDVLPEEDEKPLSKTKQPGTAAGGGVDNKNNSGGNLAGKTDDVAGLGDGDTALAARAGGDGVMKTGRLDDDDDDLVQQAQKGTSGAGFVSGVKTRGMKNNQGPGASTLDPATGDFLSQGGDGSQNY